MSSSRKRRLLWPAPVKETTASTCSCHSPTGPGALIGDSLTCGSEAMPVLFSALLPHRALRTGEMSSNARASRDESSSPVSATVSRALRGPAHQSLRGFADGSSGCQSSRSLPAVFVCLLLHPSCRSAKRPRVLLTHDLGDQITDLPRFPQVKSQFHFRVPVTPFGLPCS